MKLPIHYTDFDMDPPELVLQGAYQMKKYCSDLNFVSDDIKTKVSKPADVFFAQNYDSIKKIAEGIQKILKSAEAELDELCKSIPVVVDHIIETNSNSQLKSLGSIAGTNNHF